MRDLMNIDFWITGQEAESQFVFPYPSILLNMNLNVDRVEDAIPPNNSKELRGVITPD
jgi:hypothetical protein